MLIDDLNEIYLLFTNKYPDYKIEYYVKKDTFRVFKKRRLQFTILVSDNKKEDVIKQIQNEFDLC